MNKSDKVRILAQWCSKLPWRCPYICGECIRAFRWKQLIITFLAYQEKRINFGNNGIVLFDWFWSYMKKAFSLSCLASQLINQNSVWNHSYENEFLWTVSPSWTSSVIATPYFAGKKNRYVKGPGHAILTNTVSVFFNLKTSMTFECQWWKLRQTKKQRKNSHVWNFRDTEQVVLLSAFGETYHVSYLRLSKMNAWWDYVMALWR